MRFWTKQHPMVLKTLLETGRYTAGRKNLFADLQEHAPLMLEAYDWLSAHHPGMAAKPPEAECVVWLSYTRDAAMVPDEAGVLLELEIPSELVTPVNIAKWGMILNYAYIPAGEEDGRAHRKKLNALGLSDAKVCMSHFYPELKGVVGPHMFGYNKRTHIRHFVLYIPAGAVAAWLCTLL